MKKYLWFLALVLYAALISGCGPGANSSSGDAGEDLNFSGLKVLLIDAPVDDAEAVNVTITQVSAHKVREDAEIPDEEDLETNAKDKANNGNKNGKGDSGWTDLLIEPLSFNLLELSNGASALLVDAELEIGSYNQIRLMLDCSEGNSPAIVIEGEEHELKIPSGCSSGYKINYNFTLSGGVPATLVLDFDARKSIHQNGNGKYIMNPVIRVVDQKEAGAIIGETDPAGPQTAAYAFESGAFNAEAEAPFDSAVNSTFVQDDGGFKISGLPAGLYDIVIQAPGHITRVYVQDVEVNGGFDSLIGAIELEPEPIEE